MDIMQRKSTRSSVIPSVYDGRRIKQHDDVNAVDNSTAAKYYTPQM